MCDVINLKMSFDFEGIRRPIIIPINEEEILFIRSCQDSSSNNSEISEDLSKSDSCLSSYEEV
jgi:hypothetical protein